MKAHLWSYRHSETEIFCFDVHRGTDVYGITLQAIGKFSDDVAVNDFGVVDLSEALHIVGIFVDALSLELVIGRRGNEVNIALLEKPLADGETNGRLKSI